MTNEMYWLWLANIKNIGRKKTETLLSTLGTAEQLFKATPIAVGEVFENYKCFQKDDLTTFLASRDEEKIAKYHKKILEAGISYVVKYDPNYPNSLKNIYDPPYLLYYRGELIKDESIKIAIVGARKCSPYGKKVAEYFGKMLANNNITVVSGMARGIDSAAHIGALAGHGKTMAILGCGVNVCYPEENYHLMQEIIHSGCVLSESPINAAPLAGNFPLRNRIISGLCDGVIVVEAALKSGSLITADSALEQGKDVFAVPGRIFDPLSEGTNQLIKMGAKSITCIEDVLEEYMDLSEKTIGKETVLEKTLDQSEKEVYALISLDPIQLDTMCRSLKMNIDELQWILMKLELAGMIEQLPNKYFVKRV
ncbi:MAG: DNA-protecting protein DprA [Vallitaleaceae bacterium]|nr:DNA-protecting protein DprA [Vallitaleaceae bacterium]